MHRIDARIPRISITWQLISVFWTREDMSNPNRGVILQDQDEGTDSLVADSRHGSQVSRHKKGNIINLQGPGCDDIFTYPWMPVLVEGRCRPNWAWCWQPCWLGAFRLWLTAIIGSHYGYAYLCTKRILEIRIRWYILYNWNLRMVH